MTTSTDLKRKFEIYTKAYWRYTDLAVLLGVCPTTARRMVEEANKDKIRIRKYPRIGIPACDAIKAFSLESNKKMVIDLMRKDRK